MKKSTISILSFFVFIAVMTSCKKEYSCKCTVSTMGLSADTTMALGKLSKKDAKTKCDAEESNLQAAAVIAASMGFDVTVGCDIED